MSSSKLTKKDKMTTLTIHVQAADNPAGFSMDEYNISKRSLTNAAVYLNNVPVWRKNVDKHNIPDIVFRHDRYLLLVPLA
jgi:hypothetical protein